MIESVEDKVNEKESRRESTPDYFPDFLRFTRFFMVGVVAVAAMGAILLYKEDTKRMDFEKEKIKLERTLAEKGYNIQKKNVIGEKPDEIFYEIDGKRVYLEVDGKPVENYFNR